MLFFSTSYWDLIKFTLQISLADTPESGDRGSKRGWLYTDSLLYCVIGFWVQGLVNWRGSNLRFRNLWATFTCWSGWSCNGSHTERMWFTSQFDNLIMLLAFVLTNGSAGHWYLCSIFVYLITILGWKLAPVVLSSLVIVGTNSPCL
jgi:hypothetical protein